MEQSRQETINKAVAFFDEGYACSQSIMLAFSGRYGVDERVAKLVSSTFGGGMGRLRQKCGAVTGGFMILGLEYGNEIPNDMDTKLNAYKKVRELNKKVEDIYGTSNCVELIQKYATDKQIENRQHHKLVCRNVVADVAGLLWDIVENKS